MSNNVYTILILFSFYFCLYIENTCLVPRWRKLIRWGLEGWNGRNTLSPSRHQPCIQFILFLQLIILKTLFIKLNTRLVPRWRKWIRFGTKAEMDSQKARPFQPSKPHQINFLHLGTSHVISIYCNIWYQTNKNNGIICK